MRAYTCPVKYKIMLCTLQFTASVHIPSNVSHILWTFRTQFHTTPHSKFEYAETEQHMLSSEEEEGKEDTAEAVKHKTWLKLGICTNSNLLWKDKESSLQCQKRNLFHLDSTVYPSLSPEGDCISVTREDEANKPRVLMANVGIWCIFAWSTSKNTFHETSPRTGVFLYVLQVKIQEHRTSKTKKKTNTTSQSKLKGNSDCYI